MSKKLEQKKIIQNNTSISQYLDTSVVAQQETPNYKTVKAPIFWSNFHINKRKRSIINKQIPQVIWLTGLSGAGKTTIANELEKCLFEKGCRTYLLDGDNIRHGLSKDLGFSREDRIENIRRVSEVARLMIDAGLIVIVAFISPTRHEREAARALFEKDEFIEVFVDADIKTCIERDTKGLYAKALCGEIVDFTGIDLVYEKPMHPEVVLNTNSTDISECVSTLLSKIRFINL